MRLIDADALTKELKHITDAYGGEDGDAVFAFFDPLVRRNQLVNMEEFIKRCPTVEPKPSRDWNGWEDGKGSTLPTPPTQLVKRGRWMYTSTDLPGLSMNVCSECGFQYPVLLKVFNYCPACGAKMEAQYEVD